MMIKSVWLMGVLIAYAALCIYILLTDMVLSGSDVMQLPIFPLNR